MLSTTKRGQSWFPTILNDFIGNEWIAKMNDAAPSVNIMECEKGYRVEIATPGMSKDDFNIEIQNENQLVITMEKSQEQKSEPIEPKEAAMKMQTEECSCHKMPKEEENKRWKYLRREFSYTQFRQTLVLPDNIDRTKVSAKQENGVLTIIIPKKDTYIESQATKKIAVE